jgi:plasmid stability protein
MPPMPPLPWHLARDCTHTAEVKAVALNRDQNYSPYWGRFPELDPSVKRLIIDMRSACEHAHHMSKMVQIRNVPDALHRKLKSRAADSGQTLSDFLLAELARLAARPTRDEMLTRIHSRKRVTLKTAAAVVIREEREPA